MRTRATALFLLLLFAALAQAQTRASIDIGPYHLQSNPWVNLHQRLLYEASSGQGTPASLTDDDRATWKASVDAYHALFGTRSPIGDGPLIRINDALSTTTGDVLPETIPAPAAAALTAAMPVYRRAQWLEDGRDNRFWMSVAEPLLIAAGEELQGAQAKAYGVPFPAHVLIDVSAVAGEYGAYTTGTGDRAHSVISSLDAGSQGFASLEALMHEPGHVMLDPNNGPIGGAINRIARELNLRPSQNLWHAVMFYTAGELTRRALAARGVQAYKPVITFMYDGYLRGMKTPLETYWQPFLDGRGTREEAIRQLVIATAVQAKK
jgi:hypothetical protein